MIIQKKYDVSAYTINEIFISSRFHPTICRNQINTYTTMKNNFQKSRNIRIFISSTFQDMQSERDMLVNKVFQDCGRLPTNAMSH